MSEVMNNQYTIIYNSVEFQVDPILFRDNSTVFAQYYDPTQTMNINSLMSAESFRQCIPIVQGQNIVITRENIADMRAFAEEWGVPRLRQLINEYESVHSLDLILTNFLASANSKNPAYELIPRLAENIDYFFKNPHFLRVPPKFLHEIIKNPKCQIKNHHEFYRFIVGFVSLQPNHKSLLNFIDPTQLTEDEVNELFETKTISQTNANQNAKASNLLLNLASLYHQKYQEETQKMKKAETEIKDNERQIGHKASEIRKLKQKIAELQKEKEMQSRKEKRDKFDKKDKKDKFQKPKRSAFEKPKNDKFSYTPPSNQSQPTNSSTAQSAPVIEKRQKKPYREMQMVYCPPQNDKPSQNEQSSNSKQPEKQVLVEKSKFHYTAAVSDTPEPQKQPAQETDTTKDSP